MNSAELRRRFIEYARQGGKTESMRDQLERMIHGGPMLHTPTEAELAEFIEDAKQTVRADYEQRMRAAFTSWQPSIEHYEQLEGRPYGEVMREAYDAAAARRRPLTAHGISGLLEHMQSRRAPPDAYTFSIDMPISVWRGLESVPGLPPTVYDDVELLEPEPEYRVGRVRRTISVRVSAMQQWGLERIDAVVGKRGGIIVTIGCQRYSIATWRAKYREFLEDATPHMYGEHASGAELLKHRRFDVSADPEGWLKWAEHEVERSRRRNDRIRAQRDYAIANFPAVLDHIELELTRE